MPTTERAELAEALRHLNHTAQRQFPIVGDTEHPTPWDLNHQHINELLTLWEHTQHGERETGHRSGR